MVVYHTSQALWRSSVIEKIFPTREMSVISQIKALKLGREDIIT